MNILCVFMQAQHTAPTGTRAVTPPGHGGASCPPSPHTTQLLEHRRPTWELLPPSPARSVRTGDGKQRDRRCWANSLCRGSQSQPRHRPRCRPAPCQLPLTDRPSCAAHAVSQPFSFCSGSGIFQGGRGVALSPPWEPLLFHCLALHASPFQIN